MKHPTRKLYGEIVEVFGAVLLFIYIYTYKILLKICFGYSILFDSLTKQDSRLMSLVLELRWPSLYGMCGHG